ncbi:MAG: sulfatase [Lentisphaerae bacterium]|nr:sulfatase [Lentisphaerota bacterium]MBT4818445.1 sulfatase [Lentisphaerota bacterium]MBT5605940.1 sulfatase [Lentisphaerota bacterium]MBT7058019.1 sulfatase [Lentisphaerota bacterium]MBT7848574.1 sulfatase [Lentisphaerota bacterium]
MTASALFAGTAVEQLFGAPTGGPGKQPNILFFFADDHTCQAISAYRSTWFGKTRALARPINETPNIDRLAREGALFENSFCTNSICAPSRAVVLTGKFSHINGVRRNGPTFDGAQQTYPKLLQAAGYQTAMIGKWHLRSDPTGFDYWHVLPGQGAYYNPDFRTSEGKKRYEGYTTDVIADLSLDWLKSKRDPNRPFLLHSWHKAPHRNWQPGPKHLKTFDGVTMPEPPTLFDDYANRASPAASQAMEIDRHMSMGSDLKVTDPLASGKAGGRGGFSRLTEQQRKTWDDAYVPKNEAFREANPEGAELVRWKYQRYVKDYLRCIASVDDAVGRILAYLDEAGLADNTIVIYGSDQGFYLGEHGWFDKRWMYEESLRMPLLMRWPGNIKPGTRIPQLVQNIDYAPTLLEVAGADLPDDLQGESLVPLLKGQATPNWRKSIYYHYFEFPGGHSVRRHCGVRTERYKLMEFYLEKEWELFDLEKDPLEMKSVYDDAAYGAVRAELTAELERLKKQYGDNEFSPSPARKPRKKLIKTHPQFPVLYGVSAIKGEAGTWKVSTGLDGGYALQPVEKPYTRKVVLKGKLKTVLSGGVRNGMFAIARGEKSGDILRCGVYIGAGQYVVLANGNNTVAAKKVGFDKAKAFDVTVTADLVAKRLTLTVDGTTLEAPLKGWNAITHTGLAVNQSETQFMDVTVTGE